MKDQITAAEYRELNFQVTPQMKYRNKKHVIDGITFMSGREADYYGRLKLLEKAGNIVKIELQPKYDLVVNSEKICRYIADFRVTWASGKVTVEDTKGFKTKDYVIKRKLMKAIFGITIKEV